MPEIKTENIRVDFGKHKGQLWTRVPVSYLTWMVSIGHSRADVAQAELDRRGTVHSRELDITGHAIDRASLRLLKLWLPAREHKQQGLESWLYERALEAWNEGVSSLGEIDAEITKIEHKGIKFVFQMDGAWPVLKTVMESKRDK